MIGLPLPTLSFTIPSLHDAKLLSCRIYHPSKSNGASKRGAIVAHPYAPLGGCYDDPIVGIVGNEILKHHWIVMTFNFRGAGESQGKTSWTSNAECMDYATVAGFFIHYLALLQPHGLPASERNGTSSIDLIIGGYSYGSMIANHLAAIPAILAPFGLSKPSKAAVEITLRAEHLAEQVNEEAQEAQEVDHLAPDVSSEPPRKSFDHTLSVGGNEVLSAETATKQESGNIRQSLDIVAKKLHIRKNSNTDTEAATSQSHKLAPVALSAKKFDFPINTHYLLVSPLLPPVATLTALPFSSPDSHGEHVKKSATHTTLAIYGEDDGFTSSKKLNIWSRDIAKINPRFQGIEVGCAGHFWREPGVAHELVENVRTWVSKLTDYDTKL